MPSFPRRSSPLVGLDIQPGYVAAAEVLAGPGLRVSRVATAELDAGVVRDGEVVDVIGLATALKTLFGENDLPRRARIGVANQRVVIRAVDLPPLEGGELAAAVNFQAADLVPMPLENAVLEYQSLGIRETPAGRRAQVVLVAARRDMVMRLVEAMRAAGVRPTGVDASAFAMVRSVGRVERPEGEATLLIHVGGLTNLAVARAGACLFGRAVATGLETMGAALAERRALTLSHAREWLEHVGLQRPVELVEGEAEIVTEARRVLLDGVRTIADEARNSLDFFRMQQPEISVESALLLGPGADIDGLVEQVAADLALPVTVAPALDTVPGLAGVSLSRFAVAAGLAVEDREA